MKHEKSPLRIPIERLDETGYQLDEVIQSRWLREVLGDDHAVEPLDDGKFSATLYRAGDAVHVRGRAALKVKTRCSRCMDPIELGLNTDVEVTLFPKGAEPPASRSGEVAQADMGIATYEDGIIDLAEVLRDEVFLELPMNPSCAAEDGTPTCGKDPTTFTEASSQPTDPRWTALANIKLDSNQPN